MTKAEIIEQVHEKAGITKKDSADVVEAVFEVMKSILEQGEALKISGFGNFSVKSKSDRKGRNPQTGETITIASRKVLTYKPSSLLKQALNK